MGVEMLHCSAATDLDLKRWTRNKLQQEQQQQNLDMLEENICYAYYE